VQEIVVQRMAAQATQEGEVVDLKTLPRLLG